MKKLFNKKIFKIIYKIFKILFLIFIILLLLYKFITNKTINNIGIYKTEKSQFEAMYKYNDIIIINKKKTYKENDIILYKPNELYDSSNLTISKITKIDGNNIYTKGENKRLENPKFNKNNIYGIVKRKSKILTSFDKFLSNNLSYFLVVILPLIIILIIEIIISFYSLKCEKDRINAKEVLKKYKKK